MHDINRTQLETGWETGGLGETGYESYEGEVYPETYGETYEGAFESSYGETGGVLGEAEEMELAASLQEVATEEELDRFLGSIFNSVKKAVGSVLPRGVTNSLGGILKGVAKKFLPVAGAALGNLVAPGVGGLVGGQLANMAGQAFGLELEGLSPEDREFEIARRYVRLASDAIQEAAAIPPSVPPQVAAQQAFRASAEKNAPGLVGATNGKSPMAGQPMSAQQMPTQQYPGQQMRGTRGHSGRWVRRGRTLILFGL